MSHTAAARFACQAAAHRLAAALTLQRVARGHLGRCCARRTAAAATAAALAVRRTVLLQALWRGVLVRSRVQRMLYGLAAVKVQRVYR
jgi:IQ calmodulin-binding motif